MNYLIISSFYRLNNKLIDEIVGQNKELIKMDLNTSSLEEIIDEAKYNSLFDNNKNIVIYNCDLFSSSKNDETKQELLTSYLKNSNPNNNLIFIQEGIIDNRKKVVKALKENGKILDYSKIKYNDLLKYVNEYISLNNWNIDSDLCNYIIRTCNNNYDLICNELDKLKLGYPNNVSLDEAKLLISNNLSDNIFKFVDVVISKDYEKSLNLLKELKICKVEPTVIINMIYREFRFMYLYKVATTNNLNVESIFKNEGLMDWQLNKVADNSRRYKKEEVHKTIKLLSNYDYKYKSGVIDKSQIIELFLVDFMY